MTFSEKARLEALYDLKVLDTPREQGLDDILGLVAEICDTPMAAISLVDKHRQWFKAEKGFGFYETPRHLAFCSRAIEGTDLFEVNDTLTDSRFVSHPFVIGKPNIRSYFGQPLILNSGLRIGSLCVIDQKPRELSSLQKRTLCIMASQIVTYFDRAYRERQRKEAEEATEKHRLMALASSKMSSLGEMAAGMAHEINNPLSAILSRAGHLIDMAENNKISSQLVTKIAQEIETTGLRISKTVRALRAFARDGDNDPMQSVPVIDLFSDVMELCQQRLKQTGIEIDLNFERTDIKVHCRSVQVAQVLLNIVSNAIDATSAVLHPRITLQCSSKSDTCEIQVSNNGPQIPLDIQELIMKPFFTTKPPGHGTGLGLSISQRILENHGSTLLIDSSPEYTRFYFSLKLAT